MFNGFFCVFYHPCTDLFESFLLTFVKVAGQNNQIQKHSLPETIIKKNANFLTPAQKCKFYLMVFANHCACIVADLIKRGSVVVAFGVSDM